MAPLAAFDNDEAWFSDFSLPALKLENTTFTVKTTNKCQKLQTMENKGNGKPAKETKF